jgi:lysophospholipase L1-like esterase
MTTGTSALIRTFGRIGVAAAGIVATEAAYAILRPSPEQAEFDASTVIGSPDGVPMSILVMGDSSCTGPGLAHPDEIWVRQTAADVAALGFLVDVDSTAVGGATVSDLLGEQLFRIERERYDVALISIGGNDVLKGTILKTFEQDLERLARLVMDCADLVVLSGVGDMGTIPRLLPPLRDLLRARAKRFDAAHERVADRLGVVKADQWSSAPGVFADPSIFTPDLFHPGAVGHRAWADVATSAIHPHLDRFRV